MPTRTLRTRHPVTATICTGVILAALVGCVPQSTPEPTPTPLFASEAEAFAAAEDVYRAYNDALNVRLGGGVASDPHSFLTGLALEADIDAQNLFQSSGVRAVGTTALSSFRGLEASIETANPVIVAHVCIDVSQLRVVDANGRDVTPADRGDIVAQTVKLFHVGQDLKIADEASAEESSC